MSKSFSVDLNDYTLYRPIGNKQAPLKQRVDRSDVIAVLNGLGYSNVDERGMIPPRFGNVDQLNDCLALATIGIPTNAVVRCRALGRSLTKLLFTFTY